MTDHSDLIEQIQAAAEISGDELLHAAASALSSQSLSLSEAREEIERLRKLSDRYGVALMMIRAGCSNPQRFAGNILDDVKPIDIDLEDLT